MSAMFNAILHLIRNAVAVIMFSPSPPPSHPTISPPPPTWERDGLSAKCHKQRNLPHIDDFVLELQFVPCSPISITLLMSQHIVYMGTVWFRVKAKQMSVRVNNNFAKNIP